MTSAAMVFVPAAMLIPLASLFMFTSGDAACTGQVPTMTWAEACLISSPTPAQYNLGQETLQYAPDAAEATAYATAAATAAKLSYEATTAEAESRLLQGSPPGDMMEHCVYETSAARARMVDVVGDMSTCEFQSTVQAYVDAAAAVWSCAVVLSSVVPADSPVVAMNAADGDMTTVARALGSLAIFDNRMGRE